MQCSYSLRDRFLARVVVFKGYESQTIIHIKIHLNSRSTRLLLRTRTHDIQRSITHIA